VQTQRVTKVEKKGENSAGKGDGRRCKPVAVADGERQKKNSAISCLGATCQGKDGESDETLREWR